MTSVVAGSNHGDPYISINMSEIDEHTYGNLQQHVYEVVEDVKKREKVDDIRGSFY